MTDRDEARNEAARTAMTTKTPGVYSEDELLIRRVVMTPVGYGRMPRWSHVGAAFSIGSTSARSLCTRFGVDPDEMLGEWDDDDDR